MLNAIRPARPDDLGKLPAVERAAAALFRNTPYPHLADSSLISEEIDLLNDLIWVATDANDEPIGFVIAQAIPGSVFIREIDVDPRYARRGIGAQLIDTVAKWARGHEAPALTLTTFSDVPWNGPYYTRLGFQTLDLATLTPELKRIYQEEADAGLPMAKRIVMRKPL